MAIAMHGTEAEARAKIDEMLTQAGWVITDRSQVRMEVYVDGIAKEPDEDDPDYGHAGYVLYDRNNLPLSHEGTTRAGR